MILVDTSVWIDFLKGTDSVYRKILHRLIEEENVCLSDIILTEILMGIKSDIEFNKIKECLLEYPIYSLKDRSSYIEAAQIYRKCRQRGITIRKPIDCIIARTAIENELYLFHNDKDFDLICSIITDLRMYGG